MRFVLVLGTLLALFSGECVAACAAGTVANSDTLAAVPPADHRFDAARRRGGVVFDFGLWNSRVASRKNDDGTTSLITIDPGVDGFEFVMTTVNGKRRLVIRDGQHKYYYTAA